MNVLLLLCKLPTLFQCFGFILITLRCTIKCEASSSIDTLKNHPWKFNTTKIGENLRVGKLGDSCYYPAWMVHAKPIIEAMKLYIQVKQDLHGKFKEAKVQNVTKAQNPYEFLLETANNLHIVRKRASELVFEQMHTKSLTNPLDIRNSGNDASNLLQLICEGGEILMCQQVEKTEAGTCKCFNVTSVSPFYSTAEEDGFCMGASNSSCSPLDPGFSSTSNNCLDALTCFSYTPAQCSFHFGKNYHCDGYPKGKNYETHNMICTHHGFHPSGAVYSQTITFYIIYYILIPQVTLLLKL